MRHALLCLCLTALAASGLGAPAWADGPAVTVVSARDGVVVETVPMTGTIVAREDVLVSPQIDSLAVTAIMAEEGDLVRAGQVLATLSHDLLDASLAQNAAQIAHAAAAIAQARAQIAEADATRVQAEAALGRTSALLGTGAASRETYDQREMAAQTAQAHLQTGQAVLISAQADLALAQAQRQELMVRLDRTQIRAPVAGRISRRVARLGAVVSSAGDPLFRIIEGDTVELEAEVPETQLARLHPGEPALVTLAGETAPRPGTVRLVAPELNATTRLGRVRVSIDGHATIGQFARAVVRTGTRSGVVVPLSSVMAEADGERVQVVRGDLVETRRVTVAARDTRQAQVDGIAAGEQVVAVSGSFVRDGDRVTPVPVSAAATETP